MSNNQNSSGGLSIKAKINIFVLIFLVFIALTIFTSINPVMDIIERRKKISELEDKLNWIRNNNIGLLALEKSLYQDEAIEIEARKQFNMTKDDEINLFVVIDDEDSVSEGTARTEYGDDYSETNLWENIKIFYKKEIGKN